MVKELLTLLMFATFALTHSLRATAQTTHVLKTSRTTVTKVRESDEDDDDYDDDDVIEHRTHHTPRPKEVKENTMTSRFGAKGQSGLTGCKTEEASKDSVKDLKDDCKAWLKDQKADLADRFLTSSCEETCEDCGTSLKRCAVTGTIRYLVK